MIKKAVILAGGLATRFLPISKSVPKEMLPILNKPVLQLILEDMSKAGIKEVLIVTGRNKDAINKHFDRNVELEDRLIQTNKLDLLKQVVEPNFLCDIFYKQQLKAGGTAYSVKLAKAFVGDEPFLMMFGDELLFSRGKNAVQQLIDCYDRHNKNVIAVQSVPKQEVYKYGIISITKKVDDDYFINGIVEKPSIENAPSDVSYIGPAILTKDIFNCIDNLKVEEGKESILTEAFNELAQKGEMVACNIYGDRHDVGNKLGFLKANIYAGLHDPEIKNETLSYLKQILKDNL